MLLPLMHDENLANVTLCREILENLIEEEDLDEDVVS